MGTLATDNVLELRWKDLCLPTVLSESFQQSKFNCFPTAQRVRGWANVNEPGGT